MTDVIIDAGTLTANREDRIVTGLLLPYGEECRSNIGKFSFEAGAVTIPSDLAGMSINEEHKRENVIGAFSTATETPAGVVASFKIAATPEGDKALDDISAGRRKHLSAEVSGVQIKDGKGVAGRLFAAALVNEPAFPSATLLAAAVDTDDEEEPPAEDEGDDDPKETTEKFVDEVTDENGVTHKRTTTRTTRVEKAADGTEKTTITEKVVIEEPDPEQEPTEEEEPAVATAPNTLTAAKSGTPKTSETEPMPLATLYASIAAARAGDQEAQTLLAALSDIKISGSGALPTAGVLQSNWVGQVWQGKTYERQYINLAKLGTDITAQGKKGFKIGRGTAASPKDRLGGDWAGNKTEVPSGGGFTSTIESTLARFAWGGDFAREFWDLPGGQEVVEAFIRLIVEDYAVWSDEKALGTILTTAGTPVAPTTYPDVYADHVALGQIIQGILAVRRAKDTPSYAIANATAFDQLLYTPKDKIPEYLTFDFTTEGTGTADGKVRVVEAPDSVFTGVAAGTPAVIVGAQNAIEFDELGSVPITIDALEIAKGGIDRALHGYLQTFVVRPESIVLIGTAASAG